MNHDQALRILRWRFPTVCLWFGASTGHWWAYLNGGLIEARTPEELGRRIDTVTSLGDSGHAGATPIHGAPD